VGPDPNRRDFITAIGSAALLPVSNARAQPVVAPPLRAQRLAWAGIRLVAPSATLFVDAVRSLEGEAPSPLVAETAARFALVTHHHGDHFDHAALAELLGERGLLVCHEDVAPWLDSRGLRLQTVRTFEPLILPRASGEFVVIALPAADGFGHPQCSWLIDAGGKRIFHGGDTLWHGRWNDIGRAYGPFDLAFLPINGFRQVQGRYTETGIAMSLTPESAAAAAAALRARQTCPIHFGSREAGYSEEPDALARFGRAMRSRNLAMLHLRPGEWIEP